MFEIVSTFGEKHKNIYGQNMISSMIKYLDPDIHFTLYYDNNNDFQETDNFKILSFNSRCGEFSKKLKEFGKDIQKKYITNPINSVEYEKKKMFLYDGYRFSFKMLALIDYYENYLTNRYLVFIDGDTIAKCSISSNWLATLIPNGYYLSCLKRVKPNYTETGFFILDNHLPETKIFINNLKELYHNCKLYDLEYFIDCWAFDTARKDAEVTGKSYNLSTTEKDHVWLKSILNNRLEHYKGPEKDQK